MIDNITLIKKTLSDEEKKYIIEKSRLELKTLDGLPYYDNLKTKNFNGGIKIKICVRNILTVSGSLHKYNNYLNARTLTNFNSFTMQTAHQTFKKLFENFGIEPEAVYVSFFEIGINLKFDIDVITILDKVYSIGATDKKFIIDSYVRQKRQITTERHRDLRIVFKMYDKFFEMKDNRQPKPNIDYNILRIETVHRRVEKVLLSEFMTITYLTKLQNEFFNQWERINFYCDINAPKGTTKAKIDLVKNIIYNGTTEVLQEYKSQLDNEVITKRQYYFIKPFIDDWHNQKKEYSLKDTQIVPIFKSSYNNEKQLLTQ